MVGSHVGIVDKIYQKKKKLLNASIINGFVVALFQTTSLFLAYIHKNLAGVAQLTTVTVYITHLSL